ncbi:MAG: 30S ribosomal protein S21 [Bacteroidota bacterium]|nr:30S ribosomal protein S21 [Bacteroidota bacterium]
MIKVTIRENEAIDKALKRFKKKMEKAGTIKEFRGRRYFIKDSIKQRNMVSKAIYKQTFAEGEQA